MPEPLLVPAPLALGSRGAVVAPHHAATAAGLDILRRGGHAVDAAIATNAVLAVVVPNGCGIGGDAFWLIWDEAAQQQLALNGSGRSSRRADAADLRARGLRSMPVRGGLPITVPGAVRSWGDAHRRFGRMSRDEILGAAIELARDGFPAWPEFIAAVERTAPEVEAALGPSAAFFGVYRPHGRAWRPGERVRLPALAGTLERLARDGFDAFYDGDLAAAQGRALAEVGSPIDARDLADHRSTWTDPIATTYRGVRVTSHGPNSCGVVALEMLNVLERFEPPPSTAFGPQGVTETRWVHLGIEAAKLAMADRDAYLADPERRPVPVERLLSADHAAALAARIDPRRAARPAASTNPPGGGTVYLAAVDGDGNAVSLIESNWRGFGSGVVDPMTGIHYHNRGNYFSLEPDHPNELEPAKRPLHTLLPGMLFRDDPATGRARPWVIAGSMGGDAQPQVHTQMVSALVDGGVDVAVAVGAPRWFVEPARMFDPPVEVRIEPRFPAHVLEELEGLGHPVHPIAAFDGAVGHAHAIELVDGGPAAPDGSLAAATDPRSSGLPAAW